MDTLICHHKEGLVNLGSKSQANDQPGDSLQIKIESIL